MHDMHVTRLTGPMTCMGHNSVPVEQNLIPLNFAGIAVQVTDLSVNFTDVVRTTLYKIATHDTHWFATHGLRYQTFVFDSKAGVWGK